MSKISLKPNASGTGVFSLEAPNSNVDRTLTLPDEQGTVATIENIPPGYEDQDALDLFNVTGSAPVYACRAWVNFDGTGTVFIRGSGNVSSITDNGTGNYTVNFTTAMPDAAYCAVFSKRNAVTNDNPGYLMNVVSANQFNIQTFENNTHTDSAEVYASVFR
jgi:hypothetical protein